MQTRRSVLSALPLFTAVTGVEDLREEAIEAIDFPYLAYSVLDHFGRKVRFFVNSSPELERSRTRRSVE
jgi:hypothetical protein